MKKKLFYSLALFLFSGAFWVANSTTSKAANLLTHNTVESSDTIMDSPEEEFYEFLEEKIREAKTSNPFDQ